MGVGLSKGATCLALASFEKPDIFQSLLLMEPILYKVPGRIEKTYLSELTLKRKSEFNSIEEAYESYSKKPPMNRW